MMKGFISRTFFVISLLTVPLSAFGYNRLAYQAGPAIFEPRYDRNCLSTVEVSVMGGSTTTGRNGNKDKTDVLNIYGLHNIHRLAEGVPGLDPLNLDDAILINLIGQPNNGDFGKLKFTGKFKYIGADITLTQNFCRGFFAQMSIPVQRLEVTDIAFVDQSPTTGLPNINSAEWTQFLARFDSILERYELSKADWKDTGAGDLTILGGWTYNNDSSDTLDFMDVTIKAGLSIPTGRKRNIEKVFSLPAGHNGHVGIPVSFDMALGMLEWFTFGAHVGGQFFLKHDGVFRMKTHADQNGFMKLYYDAAREDLGNLWDIATFLKADHIAGGLSLTVGYSYTAQEDTTLAPVDTTVFTASIVNDDDMLKKWHMHTVSVCADYDFAQENKKFNPKVGIFYNHPVAGKRIFNTNTIGGNAGVNIVWNF